MSSMMCGVHLWNGEGECPDCVKENKEKETKKVETLKILIKEPIRTDLKNIHQQQKMLEEKAQLLLNGYLVGAGHTDGKGTIDPDFNFITITKEEKSNDKKDD